MISARHRRSPNVWNFDKRHYFLTLKLLVVLELSPLSIYIGKINLAINSTVSLVLNSFLVFVRDVCFVLITSGNDDN